MIFPFNSRIFNCHVQLNIILIHIPWSMSIYATCGSRCQELKEASKALKQGLSFNSRFSVQHAYAWGCTLSTWHLALDNSGFPGGMLIFTLTWACFMLRRKSGTKPRLDFRKISKLTTVSENRITYGPNCASSIGSIGLYLHCSPFLL